MSTTLIIAPIVIASWPAISGAAIGAAAALGFALTKEAQALKAKIEGKAEACCEEVEISMENSEILEKSLHAGQEMVFSKDNVTIRITRDERGRCVVCASGTGHTKTELKTMAEQFSQKLTQCFTYNRVMTELKNKNFNVVNEEVMTDESVRIHVRRWVD
jgi:translation initiation factor 1 (eIF-1/SUI1)